MTRTSFFLLSMLAVLVTGVLIWMRPQQSFPAFQKQFERRWEAYFSDERHRYFVPEVDQISTDLTFCFEQQKMLAATDSAGFSKEYRSVENKISAKIEWLKSWAGDPKRYHLLPGFRACAGLPEHDAGKKADTLLAYGCRIFDAGKLVFKIKSEAQLNTALEQQTAFFRFLKSEFPTTLRGTPAEKQKRLQNLEALLLDVKDFIAFLNSQKLKTG
ncbi:MAG TPA: hypothetical protein PKC40_09345 [Saprospiraceae bacterium]|nr:hypothetical protein [Saprospiraceae bacterium]